MYWLGRHAERAEAACRLLRSLLTRLSTDEAPDDAPELPTLIRCLAAQGQIEPGYAVEGMNEQLPSLGLSLPRAVFDLRQIGSLRSTIQSLYRNASQVRDRLSLDSWRILLHVQQSLETTAQTPRLELLDVLELIHRVIRELAAFDGMLSESMTRALAWRFLDLGRRMERALQTLLLLQNSLCRVANVESSILEAVLEVADSSMTYRSRYLASLQVPPVLDLLLTDDTNPRSLVFQLAALADHVENLPREMRQPLLSDEQRIVLSALHSVRMLDVETLSEMGFTPPRSALDRLLERLASQLPRLADLISHRYLVHAGLPRQLAEGT
jgi:uncharacterized alpha-E superfamily protein